MPAEPAREIIRAAALHTLQTNQSRQRQLVQRNDSFTRPITNEPDCVPVPIPRMQPAISCRFGLKVGLTHHCYSGAAESPSRE